MSTLKVVDFGTLHAKETLFWRAMLRHFLLCFKSGHSLQEVLRRVAGKSDLARQLRHFVKNVLGPWAATQCTAGDGVGRNASPAAASAEDRLLLRVRLAEQCLKSVQREG